MPIQIRTIITLITVFFIYYVFFYPVSIVDEDHQNLASYYTVPVLAKFEAIFKSVKQIDLAMILATKLSAFSATVSAATINFKNLFSSKHQVIEIEREVDYQLAIFLGILIALLVRSPILKLMGMRKC